MLIFFPHSGLANRMRATLSALQLASDKNLKIRILWLKDSGLNCEWNKLFNKYPFVIDCPLITFRFFCYLIKIVRVLHLDHLINVFHANDFELFQEFTKSEISNQKLTIASSFSEFYQGVTPAIRDVFVLVPELMERVEAIVSGFATNTIGVHIRRSDNHWAIEHSPMNLFEESLNKEIEKDNNVKFFVASDDLSCIEYLIKKYGSRIITSKGELTRNSVTGIQQAAVELYVLASCKFIIGSYYSSFSEMAAKLGGIPLYTVKKE